MMGEGGIQLLRCHLMTKIPLLFVLVQFRVDLSSPLNVQNFIPTPPTSINQLHKY